MVVITTAEADRYTFNVYLNILPRLPLSLMTLQRAGWSHHSNLLQLCYVSLPVNCELQLVKLCEVSWLDKIHYYY